MEGVGLAGEGDRIGRQMILCTAHNLPVRHDPNCYRQYRRGIHAKTAQRLRDQRPEVWRELAVKVWRVENRTYEPDKTQTP